ASSRLLLSDTDNIELRIQQTVGRHSLVIAILGPYDTGHKHFVFPLSDHERLLAFHTVIAVSQPFGDAGGNTLGDAVLLLRVLGRFRGHGGSPVTFSTLRSTTEFGILSFLVRLALLFAFFLLKLFEKFLDHTDLR